jgi:hypothetical protein
MGSLFSSDEYNQDKYKKVKPGQNIYNKDKKYVYWRGELVNGADVKTFVNHKNGYGKDAKHVFYNGYILQTVDISSFTGLKYGYAKDSKKVYYKGKVLIDADAETFKVKDGNKHEKEIKTKR